MNKIKPALIAAVGLLFLACKESKTENILPYSESAEKIEIQQDMEREKAREAKETVEAAKESWQEEKPAKGNRRKGSRTFVKVLTDPRDGKKYRIVEIGNQVWMAENLNYNIDGSVCYDNKLENCNKYGRLYIWKIALEACPSGWHLPNYSEWSNLVKHINSSSAGKQLKSKTKWNGTDNYAFSALPGGIFDCENEYSDDINGRFIGIGNFGIWWTTTPNEECNTCAHDFGIRSDKENIIEYHSILCNGLSVRCIKN
jgi:uncharacterized protein (TIGR02145 family)